MRFAQLIAGISSRFPIKSISSCNAPDLTDVAFIEGSRQSFADDVLYFGYMEKTGDPPPALPPQCILAGDCEPPQAGASCLATVAPNELFAVFNLARRLVDESTGRGLYDELVAAADSTQDFNALINTAASKLGNSLIFSDCEFRIIASSTSVPVMDALWVENVRQGYCNYEFISTVTQFESIRKASYSPDAIEVSCDQSPFRKLSSKVIVRGVQVGFVLLIASESPVTQSHFQMLKNVSMALSYMIENYAGYLFQSVDQYQQILYNLLIGASPDDLRLQIQSLELPPSMLALCARETRSLGEKHMKETVGPGLARLLPGLRYALYKGGVAAMLPLNGAAELTAETMTMLNEFAAGQSVSIGVSYAFDSIDDYPAQYQQAVTALDLSREMGSTANVIQYRDFQFFDLLSQCGDRDVIGKYCHPALKALRKYDHLNGSELYKTLRAYVDNGARVKETSESMFIHRNSLMYRLDRIREITALDINAPANVFHLKLSFVIEQYIGLGS